MLITDAPYIEQSDLESIDSSVSDVATAEEIDLPTHIQVCIDEFSDWLQAKQITFSGYIPPFNVPSTASYALVNTLTQASQRTRASLSQILSTDGDYPQKWSPLKRAAVYDCLYKFFRQASRRKEIDRYERRKEDYLEEFNRRYLPLMKRRGIPIVNRPFPAPAAYQEIGTGTFDDSNLSRANDIATINGDPTYEIVVTWVDSQFYQSSSQNQNGESAGGPIASIVLHAGDFAVVDISTLNGPNGQYKPSAIANIPITPMNTTGWNVYLSVAGGPFYLQNSTPIPYATKTYEVDPVVTSGFALTNGQWADIWIPIPDLCFRG